MSQPTTNNLQSEVNMNQRKHDIEVRDEVGNRLETISRVLRAEQCGNFNPIFCTYKGNRELVKSTSGDLSDPFRRDESYLSSLYIQPKDGGKLELECTGLGPLSKTAVKDGEK